MANTTTVPNTTARIDGSGGASSSVMAVVSYFWDSSVYGSKACANSMVMRRKWAECSGIMVKNEFQSIK